MALTAVRTSPGQLSPALPQPQPLQAEQGADLFSDIDGASPDICALKHHMRRVARDAFVTVLILGESGTGKERVASAIHRASSRSSAPFVAINCAGLSSTLAEDQLFGHMRGAFTSAVNDQPGPFERGNGGTVFLDEVGELTPEIQIKLLRALQQRTVQRLGGVHEIGFEVRVMAATNVDLAKAVARGRFREDLYYRLRVYELRVPPLRGRGATDIKALADALLGRLARRRHVPPPTLDPSAFHFFTQHRWPGNVRELENTLERMMVAADGGAVLTMNHLPENVRTTGAAEGSSAVSRPLPSSDEVWDALERHGFKRSQASAELGLSRHQLYRWLKRHGVSCATATS